MIKIGIVDDIPRLAEALKNKIELAAGLKVVSISSHGKELLENLNKNSNLDILFMDINMPIMNGIEATAQVSQRFPHIKVIMCSVYDDEENIFDAILAGAQGYLLKDENPSEMHNFIEEVMAGGAPMSPEIAKKSLSLIRLGKPKTAPEIDYGLTKREKEILTHLSTGLTYEQIAGNLIISKGTVRKHVENIYKKLQVNSRVEALRKVQ